MALSRQDYKVGQKVYFGRPNGEQTLGKVIKLNPSKAKVQTLEGRGNGRGSSEGATWTVPYSLMRPADALASAGDPAPPVPKEKLTYNPFNGEDNLILEAIVQCHSGLSPENLACDGEASRSHIIRVGGELRRKLKHLQLALGREVDEIEAYEWADSKAKYQRERQKTA